jgi:hypothetical protein
MVRCGFSDSPLPGAEEVTRERDLIGAHGVTFAGCQCREPGEETGKLMDERLWMKQR